MWLNFTHSRMKNLTYKSVLKNCVRLDSRQFRCFKSAKFNTLNRFRGFVVSTLSFGEHSRSPAMKFKANKLNLMTFNFPQFVLSRGLKLSTCKSKLAPVRNKTPLAICSNA